MAARTILLCCLLFFGTAAIEEVGTWSMLGDAITTAATEKVLLKLSSDFSMGTSPSAITVDKVPPPFPGKACFSVSRLRHCFESCPT
jgi:hypothetical protein